MSKELSNRFVWMSLLCASFVVLIHVAHDETVGTFSWFLWQIGSEGICRIAVPFFFVASGFWLGIHVEEKGWWHNALLRRCRTLLVPYFLWLSIALPLASLSYSHKFGVVDFFGLNFFVSPGLVQFWYIRSLLLLVLLSPIILWIVRRKLILGFFLVTVFALYGFISPVTGCLYGGKLYEFCRHFFSLEGLFYFAIGMMMSVYDLNFLCRRSLVVMMVIVASIAFVLRTCLVGLGINYAYYVAWIAIPIALVAVWNLIPCYCVKPWMTKIAFPVYVLHKFIVSVFNSQIHSGHITGWCGYVGVWLLSCTLAVGGALFLHRFFPRVSCVIFAGR